MTTPLPPYHERACTPGCECPNCDENDIDILLINQDCSGATCTRCGLVYEFPEEQM